MNLIDLPFNAGEVSNEQVREIAASLQDASFASAVYAKGTRMLESRADAWVPRITLLAANRLNRAKDFLLTYQGFLSWMDTQTKKDWYSSAFDNVPAHDLFAQSGLSGLPHEQFAAESQRLLENIGPPDAGPILDVGCGGGLWALKLAQHGYQVIGTDKHTGILAAARDNAAALGLQDRVQFIYDDACSSQLPPEYFCSRVLCISVSPCMADDGAFNALIAFLDRASRVPGKPLAGRMVVLAGNRWTAGRMLAVADILASEPDNFVQAAQRLFVLELNWWMQTKHVEAIKQQFPIITLIGERTVALDGVREDLLLQ
jgi:SAM-dependent methyltransferase